MAKPRVLISSDIGGLDPDDIQSTVHAFLYADKFDLVGLVSTPTTMAGRAADFHKVIDVYAQDYTKLNTWSSDYPTPDYLHSIVSQGAINKAPSQGWSNPSEGSKAIIAAAHASSEPLWVLTWGGMTDIAQALHDDPSIAGKIKLMSIGSWNTQAEPAARDYVYNNFKNLWWVEDNSTARGMYVDDNGHENNSWKMSDAQGHGALGDYFYNARPWGLKMGDTPSLLYLLDSAPDNDPTVDGWGGAFVKTSHGPNYWTDSSSSSLYCGPYPGAQSVQNDQPAIYADFAARLDHAKAANPNGSGGGTTTPPPSSGDGGSGTDHPVYAVDDAGWSTGVNQTMWQNARFLLINDKGLDGGLKVTSVASKSAAGASVAFAADGTMTYRPLTDWQGKDSVEYTVTDANGSTDTGVYYVQVGTGGTTTPPPSSGGGTTPPPSGAAVVAVDDLKTTDVNQTLWHNARFLTWNDKGEGALKVTAVDAKSAAGVDVSFASDGTITYKPLANWQGKDCINYTVTDADGCTDTGTFHIQVGSGGPVMTPLPPSGGGTTTPPPSSGGTGNPVIAVDDAGWSTGVNQTMWQNARYLLINDEGLDGGLKVTSVASKSAAGASVSFASDGTMTYKPVANWQGKDSVEYTVSDADGSTDTGVYYVQVGAGGSTTPPPSSGGSTTPPPSSGDTGTPIMAHHDYMTAESGQALYFNTRYLTWNDDGGDGALTVKSLGSTSAKGFNVSWDANTGTAIYKAPAGFTGQDSVLYTVADAGGSTDYALVNFDVLLA
ncbi:MAG: DUF1593 domain-containing protein [Rhodospirillales bacterium]|nr:DUF1593 domain-containing protein [Rhodospirillales bacterium]